MRGCLSSIITILILLGIGSSGIIIFELIILILLDPNASGLSDIHWYTWATMIIVPLLLLKLLVKVSRLTADYICDWLGVD